MPVAPHMLRKTGHTPEGVIYPSTSCFDAAVCTGECAPDRALTRCRHEKVVWCCGGHDVIPQPTVKWTQRSTARRRFWLRCVVSSAGARGGLHTGGLHDAACMSWRHIYAICHCAPRTTSAALLRCRLILGLVLAFALLLYWTHEPGEGLVLQEPSQPRPPALLRHIFICVSFAWRPLKIVYLKQARAMLKELCCDAA